MAESPLDRRQLLRWTVLGSAALAGASSLTGVAPGYTHPARAAAASPAAFEASIRRRSEWATAGPVGPLSYERDEDVRFLLVHHTVTPNEYSRSQSAGTLRGIYSYHTANKGLPDIAYNFMVDRHGVVWEARQGSIARPVMGSATGGSQGHAILCCFLGDHQTYTPTAAAQSGMAALLAWLGTKYGIDTRPGAMTHFVSRGSNRWPAGTVVQSLTVEGHRAMSQTVCPGDAGFAVVRGALPHRATALRDAWRTTAAFRPLGALPAGAVNASAPLGPAPRATAAQPSTQAPSPPGATPTPRTSGSATQAPPAARQSSARPSASPAASPSASPSPAAPSRSPTPRPTPTRTPSASPYRSGMGSLRATDATPTPTAATGGGLAPLGGLAAIATAAAGAVGAVVLLRRRREVAAAADSPADDGAADDSAGSRPDGG